MAGEAILINPRHRRRRRKTRARARTHRRKRARARRNPFAMNPRRRRRAVSHRRARRRAHRNPRIPLLGNVNMNAIGAGAAGYIGTRYATTWALSFLPPQWMADPNTAPLVRIGTKAVVGMVALPMLFKALRIRGVAGAFALGAGIAVAEDLFRTYLERFLPLPAGVSTLGEYETQTLSAYETAQLSGSDTGAYGSGAFAGSAY
jgi:hypothetical protein